MIFAYYICALLLGVGLFCLIQVWNAAYFTIGLHLIALAILFILHFFAKNPESVVYLGLLLYGMVAFLQSGIVLNYLKKALIDDPNRN